MKLPFLFLLVLLFFSCSRDSIQPPDPGTVSEISFDLNGIHYKYPGIGYKSIAGNMGMDTSYTIGGYKDPANYIDLIMYTDSLKTTTYHLIAGSFMRFWAENYPYFLAGNDFIDITITDYKNGTVEGNFAGSITKFISYFPAVTQPATITNGVFKNVKIQY